MTDWIECAASSCDADKPFHAGVAVDFIRNNLIVAYEQSAYDVQCFHHESYTAGYTFSVSDAWRDLTSDFDGWMIPMRKDDTDACGWRDIQVSIEGKNSAAGNVYVRCHLFPYWNNELGVDDTDGFGGGIAYGTLIFSTTDWEVKTTTVAVGCDDVGETGVPTEWVEGMPNTRHKVCTLQLIAKASTSSHTISLRGPRFREVT